MSFLYYSAMNNSPVAVVHCISKSWRVDDGQGELDTPLLHQDFGLLHLQMYNQRFPGEVPLETSIP